MLDPRIERMLEETRANSSLSASAARDLREAVVSSPTLQHALLGVVESGAVKHITVSRTPNEGGHYDQQNRTINIDSSLFQRPVRSERVDQLTAVLGHETGHALMAHAADIRAHTLAFRIDEALKHGSQYGDAVVDITPFAKEYVAAARQDEALAELLGINAVTSRVKMAMPGVDRRELLERLDPTTPCVTNGALAPGVNMASDAMLYTGGRIQSPVIEAVAVCQFDRSASTLGEQGKSNYNDYYLAYVISSAAELIKERGRSSTHPMPRIGLNLDELGSSVEQIEAAGVRLGAPGRVFGFNDMSGGRPVPVEIHQVGSSDSVKPSIAPVEHRAADVLADNPAHADHQTFNRIHEWVKGTGNWNEAESRNVSAALYQRQMENPIMQRVDQVTGGLGKDGAHNVIAVYAPFGDKGPFFHAHVDGRQAAQQPAEQSLQQAETQQQSQDRQMTQDRAQQQEQAAAMTR